MEAIYLTDADFGGHLTGDWHPERPARLAAAERGVFGSKLEIVKAPIAIVDPEILELTHPVAYVESIRRFCLAGGGALDADTVASSGSWPAAIRAAGAGPSAVAALADSSAVGAFCAVRPPGHHALATQAMGFCLFNNVVVVANLLAGRGQRVAIIDWDVHHGNGTQALVGSNPAVLYVSLHQYPFYPGGGDVTDIVEGEGTIVDLPMPSGTGGDVYRLAFERIIVPVVSQFSPDWILVSAGYDAHEEDPLAELRLVASDYRMMAASIAPLVPPGRIVILMEGGYHLTAITASVAATLDGLALGDSLEPSRQSPSASFAALDRSYRVIDRYWGLG